MRMVRNNGWFSLLSGPRPARRAALVWAACALATAGATQAQTATESVILSFANFPRGANPFAPLLAGTGGALYGTTYEGGQSDLGVVFELAGGSYKVLYSFKGASDGAKPYAGLAQDAAGNLYGTTYQGGTANAGVVYKLTPSGQETVLYSFTGGADGGNPYAGVIVDSAGNLYGTAYGGGANNCTGGCGVVYKSTVWPRDGTSQLHGHAGWRQSLRRCDLRFRRQSIRDYLRGRSRVRGYGV